MQFNEKLKKLRIKKGISQTALAQKIFVSRSAIAKWENGLGLPSEQSLNMLADFFGVEPSELLSDPVIENVIVAKNSKISSQQLLLISISIFAITAVIVLTALCGYFAVHHASPTVSRRLIFETEKGVDVEEIPIYSDDEISADHVFAACRTFEIKQSVGAVRLPELLVKTTVNGSASYESVDPSRVSFSFSDNIILRYERAQEQGDCLFINVLPVDYYAAEFCEWANIKYGELFISIKVFRKYTPVENVTVGFLDNSSEIGLTQSKALNCDIKPYNANYTDHSYTIDKIIRPDGRKYEGDLAQYAYIENNYLTATKHIEPGSVIYLFATARHDNIKSNFFEVTVVRIGIERIKLTLPYSASYIYLGESKPITLKVYPDNASFNVLEEKAEITLLTPEWATLEGGILTVSTDINAVGKKIAVMVDTPEGISKTFCWDILAKPSESTILINSGIGKVPGKVISGRDGDLTDNIRYALHLKKPVLGTAI